MIIFRSWASKTGYNSNYIRPKSHCWLSSDFRLCVTQPSRYEWKQGCHGKDPICDHCWWGSDLHLWERLTSILWQLPSYNWSVCFDYFHQFLFVICPHTTHFLHCYKWYLTLIAKQRVPLKWKYVLSFVLSSSSLVTNWKTTIPLWSNVVFMWSLLKAVALNQILIKHNFRFF